MTNGFHKVKTADDSVKQPAVPLPAPKSGAASVSSGGNGGEAKNNSPHVIKEQQNIESQP